MDIKEILKLSKEFGREKICGIYAIYCIADDKIYIGQSVNVKDRLQVHRSMLRKGDHPNNHLQRAWSKYNECLFSYHLLDVCLKEDLTSREAHFVHLVDEDKRFNQGAISSHCDMSDELKKHLSIKHTGKKLSKEHKDSLSKNNAKFWKGKTFSEEHKRKLSEAKKGKPSPRKNFKMDEGQKMKLSNIGKQRRFIRQDGKFLKEIK